MFAAVDRLEDSAHGHLGSLRFLCERTREDAFDILMAHAERHGANAVVGVRYDATDMMSGVTEVLCYGTAVIVERADGDADTTELRR